MGKNRPATCYLALIALLAIVRGPGWADQPIDGEPPLSADAELYPVDGAYAGHASVQTLHARDLWGRIEFLLWSGSDDAAPPLVTTSPATVSSADAGALDQNTTILFGGRDLSTNVEPGYRISLGQWLDDCHCTGIGARFAALDSSTTWFSASEADFPVLARPFYNISSNEEDALLIAYPGERSGSITVASTADAYSGDLYLRRRGLALCGGELDFLVGYQYGRLAEQLLVSTQSTFLTTTGTIPQGTTVEMSDLFATRNEFHGAMIGVMATFERPHCVWECIGKLGLGDMRSLAMIRGQTTTTTPGDPPSTTGTGLLAQPSNSGAFESRSFVVSPELGINATWRVHPCMTLSAGYSFIYWSNVLRPGEQIDLDVDPTQTVARPQYGARLNDYVLHGANFGLTCRF